MRATLLTIGLFLFTAAPAAADIIDAGPATPVSAVEGTQFTATVAEFDLDCTGGGDCPDPATMTATVDWGDSVGSHYVPPSRATVSRVFSTDGTTATYTVVGGYAYFGVSGKLKTTVDVKIAPDTLRFVGEAIVADAPLSASVESFDVAPGETVDGAVARFTDPGGAPVGPVYSQPGYSFNYAMSLDWGDGSSTTPWAAVLSQGAWATVQTHRYARVGVYTISFHVQDPGGSAASATGTVVVEPLAIAVKASRRQRLHGGGVRLTVTPTLQARLKAGGTVTVPGRSKVYRLTPVSLHTANDTPTTLTLRLPRAAQKAVRAALRLHEAVIARVKVTATGQRVSSTRLRPSVERARRISLVP